MVLVGWFSGLFPIFKCLDSSCNEKIPFKWFLWRCDLSPLIPYVSEYGDPRYHHKRFATVLYTSYNTFIEVIWLVFISHDNLLVKYICTLKTRNMGFCEPPDRILSERVKITHIFCVLKICIFPPWGASECDIASLPIQDLTI